MKRFLAIILSVAIIMSFGTSRAFANISESNLENSGCRDNCSWVVPTAIGVGLTLVVASGIIAYKLGLHDYINQIINKKIRVVGKCFESDDLLTYAPRAGVEYIEKLVNGSLPRFGASDEIQARRLSTVQSFCNTAKMIVRNRIENGDFGYTWLYNELFAKENIIMQIQRDGSTTVGYLRNLLNSVKDLLVESSNL